MKRTLIVSFLLFLCGVLNAGDEFCGIHNSAFQAGESSTYTVYYTLGVYIAAGEATFNVIPEQLNNKPVYHITGEGKTYSFYDSFFKVRDKYETYIDTGSLQPMKFIRHVDEGGYKKYE